MSYILLSAQKEKQSILNVNWMQPSDQVLLFMLKTGIQWFMVRNSLALYTVRGTFYIMTQCGHNRKRVIEFNRV